jgi:hypothetical protein
MPDTFLNGHRGRRPVATTGQFLLTADNPDRPLKSRRGRATMPQAEQPVQAGWYASKVAKKRNQT